MNFILYENDKTYINKYKNIIYEIMGSNKLNLHLYEFSSYNLEVKNKLDKIEGNKIYIIDIEVPGKNGLDLARQIRNSGDWISPIIVVTSHEEFKIVGYTEKILMLDFISKREDLKKSLYDALIIALKINSSKECFCFTIKSEIYQIPYDDILYIEKSLNNNSSILVTTKNKYVFRKTISKLEKELNNDFVKTHRSCIVNTKNITKIDFENNLIYFNDKYINLLSRNNKKILKEKVNSK